MPLEESVSGKRDERGDFREGESGAATGEVQEVFLGAVVKCDEGFVVSGEETVGVNSEVFLGTGGADLEDFIGGGVKEEVVGLAVGAAGMAVVAVMLAEGVHEEGGVFFVVAENLLDAADEGDGAEIDERGIALLDGEEARADGVNDFNGAGDGGVVAVGVALLVIGEGDGDGAGFGIGELDGGLSVAEEDFVEVLDFLLEDGLV